MNDYHQLTLFYILSGQMFHPNAISNAKSGELLIQTERRENNVCLEQTHANVI